MNQWDIFCAVLREIIEGKVRRVQTSGLTLILKWINFGYYILLCFPRYAETTNWAMTKPILKADEWVVLWINELVNSFVRNSSSTWITGFVSLVNSICYLFVELIILFGLVSCTSEIVSSYTFGRVIHIGMWSREVQWFFFPVTRKRDQILYLLQSVRAIQLIKMRERLAPGIFKCEISLKKFYSEMHNLCHRLIIWSGKED